jgi:hypothetical protein
MRRPRGLSDPDFEARPRAIEEKAGIADPILDKK